MIWDKFRRQPDKTTAPTVPEQLDDPEEPDDEVEGEPEVGAEHDAAEPWRERAAAVIPGGSSTGSKRVEALYGDAPIDDRLPTHYARARGCSLWLVDGDAELEVVDCTMALGSVAIGYADAHVLAHVGQAAALGNVAGVPHMLEVTLAERLCDFIPCAEQVRFLKSGAEARSFSTERKRDFFTVPAEQFSASAIS